MEKKLEVSGRSYTLRPYRTEDEPELLSLWKAAFGKELPPDIWRWKYHGPPAGSKIMVCTDDQGVVVAMFGGVTYAANLEGRRIEIGQLMDNMSHPDIRRTGIFVRTIYHYVDTFTGPEKYVVLDGFPGRYHFEIGSKYCQYREIKPGISFLAADLMDIVRGKETASEVVLEEKIDNRFDRLWENCMPDYPFAAVRDADFLRWRYEAHPVREYRIWGYHPAGAEALEGYAVILQEDQTAVIVDLLISAPEEAKIDSFVLQLASILMEKGFHRIKTWLPDGHFLSKALASSGFNRQAEPLGIIPTARVFDPSITFEWAGQNLFYTMGDADLY